MTKSLRDKNGCQIEGRETEVIFAHPAFTAAMEEAQDELRTGAAEWHSYGEVFGEGKRQ